MIRLPRNPNTRVALSALAGVCVMTGAAFAAVPLYDLFCRVTGYGGTTQVADGLIGDVLDREVTVYFDANTNRDLPWEFEPLQRSITLNVGESGLAYYRATNSTDTPLTGVATFNVAPFKAGPYFSKIECFCFTEQQLKAGEVMDMPVQFYVDPADRLWLELNQLYLLAERLGVEDDTWTDQENHSRSETTVAQAYLRPILLALCKPNQLRHRQLSMVFNALELWAPSVTIGLPDGNSLFCVDLDCHQGPRYENMMIEPLAPRCLHTEDLVWELEAFAKDLDGKLPMPEQFPPELVSHLADAWGAMRQRACGRT